MKKTLVFTMGIKYAAREFKLNLGKDTINLDIKNAYQEKSSTESFGDGVVDNSREALIILRIPTFDDFSMSHTGVLR